MSNRWFFDLDPLLKSGSRAPVNQFRFNHLATIQQLQLKNKKHMTAVYERMDSLAGIHDIWAFCRL